MAIAVNVLPIEPISNSVVGDHRAPAGELGESVCPDLRRAVRARECDRQAGQARVGQLAPGETVDLSEARVVDPGGRHASDPSGRDHVAAAGRRPRRYH